MVGYIHYSYCYIIFYKQNAIKTKTCLKNTHIYTFPYGGRCTMSLKERQAIYHPLLSSSQQDCTTVTGRTLDQLCIRGTLPKVPFVEVRSCQPLSKRFGFVGKQLIPLLRVFVISMRLVENTGISLDPLYHVDFLGVGEFPGDALDVSAFNIGKTIFLKS